MVFFFSLLIEGALAGALYALIALAFVVVYKASRVVNFALGEWLTLAGLLMAMGLPAWGLDLAGAIPLSCVRMLVVAVLVHRRVLQHLIGKRLISLRMVTLGVGAHIRVLAQVGFCGVPSGIQLPIPTDPWLLHQLRVPSDKLIAALV